MAPSIAWYAHRRSPQVCRGRGAVHVRLSQKLDWKTLNDQASGPRFER
jgi:hypothetical protein